ncbi:DotI/IcmL family type IV secretion protein [Legionella septentrionalis]|uniref:Type IV secretion protein IcmL n=1 Tax=Legionella septentrionalis TaxID=2498109 RepID=A0A433JHP5_9GAMM|nr:DotI/IcmL family type IV secretion protein [Legionella septentrionalis]RUQ81741.1 type IV secretion protein IcmL [Legionella septentrionalis]
MSYLKKVLFGFLGCFFYLNAWAETIVNPALSVWVNEAIVSTYTYDYKNFLQRQKEIARYFTSQGWINYSKAFTESKLPETVQKNAYEVSAVAAMPPEITGLRDNHWRAVMPLLVVYKNPQYVQKQMLAVSIEFTAVPKGQGIRGLAIVSLQSKVIEPPCKCANESVGTAENAPSS